MVGRCMQLDFRARWCLLASLVTNIYKYLVPDDLTMNKMIMIAASVAVALLIIVALVWFFYPKSKSGESTGSPGILGGSDKSSLPPKDK